MVHFVASGTFDWITSTPTMAAAASVPVNQFQAYLGGPGARVQETIHKLAKKDMRMNTDGISLKTDRNGLSGIYIPLINIYVGFGCPLLWTGDDPRFVEAGCGPIPYETTGELVRALMHALDQRDKLGYKYGFKSPPAAVPESPAAFDGSGVQMGPFDGGNVMYG